MKKMTSESRNSSKKLGAAGLGLLLFAGLLALGSQGCGGTSHAAGQGDQRVIVLGFDGMDYALTRDLISQGKMPNFERLAAQGTFTHLGTSAPPLSPVAWSNFITGMDSGGHGIFDFIHRDPKTMVPYLSTSLTHEPEPVKVLGIEIPFWTRGGGTELMRRGEAFWEVLEEKGIRTEILRMPANYPPTGKATRELSGMGTPDMMGTYGTFSFYTSELFFPSDDVGGGEVYEAWEENGVVKENLYGPAISADGKKKMEAPFEVYIDPEDDLAKLVVGDEERILAAGEWSDWVPVTFELSAIDSIDVVARFYLRSVRPEFEMYVSPLNFDPRAPMEVISTPEDYAAELADATGVFYTQGMPEDTKALSEGILSVDEFLAQAKIAGEELEHQYHYVLDQFDEGLLFYYFGNLDQVSHMLWRAVDPEHPAYDVERDAPYAQVVEDLYRKADEIVGYTLERMGDETQLIIMSDHGFTSWRRSFHLNNWLFENGYLAVRNKDLSKDPGYLLNIDWSRTRAYGLGLNGLYVNLPGRERDGIVDPAQRRALLEEIRQGLLQVIDPETGAPAITKVYLRDDFEYQQEAGVGPDMVIGYAKKTRGSNESAGGAVPPTMFSDNTEEWSGDHGMDHETVPGILLASQPMKKPATSLQNLAASILAEFGIEGFPRVKKADD